MTPNEQKKKPLRRWMHFRKFTPVPGTDGPWAAILIVYERKSRTRTEEAPYLLREIPSDLGRGFLLDKVGVHGDPEADCYHVHVAGNGDQTCECRAHLRWGRCRHTAAVRKLLEDGRIPGGIPAPGST